MKLSSYEDALSYIYQQIPTTPQTEFPGEQGVKRARTLMSLLGDPQEQLKVIHLAGTSGKGSTAVMVSKILESQGFAVGLHLSPHILDIRERCQINNAYISQEKFVHYLNEIIPHVEKLQSGELGKPTYFEILVALAFYAFFKEGVEYAVIETGLGGLYDGTNVVHSKSKIVVITQLGIDHTKVLGDTLADIAYQKAGIIQPENKVIAAQQSPEARKITNTVAKNNNAQLVYLTEEVHFRNIDVTEERTQFTYAFNSEQRELSLGLLGRHQAQNASLALAAVQQAARQYRFIIDWGRVEEALRTVHLPARADKCIVRGKTVMLDGAHNPQKIEAFLSLITQIFNHKKKVFVIAFKQGKDSEEMLAQISRQASHIVLTGFTLENQDMPHFSQDPQELASMLEDRGFTDVTVAQQARNAVEVALGREEEVVVITGSLYFLSVVYSFIHSMDL